MNRTLSLFDVAKRSRSRPRGVIGGGTGEVFLVEGAEVGVGVEECPVGGDTGEVLLVSSGGCDVEEDGCTVGKGTAGEGMEEGLDEPVTEIGGGVGNGGIGAKLCCDASARELITLYISD